MLTESYSCIKLNNCFCFHTSVFIHQSTVAVVQCIRRLTLNPEIAGSNPGVANKFYLNAFFRSYSFKINK